jgi:hypothetical protein
MQVHYLLYNEDHNKIEGMRQDLTDCPDGLFDPRWLRRMHVADDWNGREWDDVIFIHLDRVGTNVLRYNVTLPRTDEYPALVAALLIDHGWEVKVRYRNDEANYPWTYMKCDFPEGTRYALPADWQE